MPTGMWQGVSAGLKDVSQTGMGLLNLQATQQHQQALENIANEQLKIQQATAGAAAEEYAKKKANYDRPIDVTVMPGYLSRSDKGKEEFLNFMVKNKFVNDQYIGKHGDIEEGLKLADDTLAIFKRLAEPELAAGKAKLTELWSAYQEALSTGDAKKIQTARALYDQKRAGFTVGLEQYLTHLDKLEKDQAARDLKQMEIDAREPKVPVIRSVDRGDVVDIYTNGVFTRTEKKGVSPGTGVTPSNERLSGKEKTDMETALLQDPSNEAAPAWAARYNELSATDEYVKQTKVKKWWPDEEVWVKQPKISGGTAPPKFTAVNAPPKFTAVNAKGLKIFSNDGMTWTDSKGKVIK